MMDRPFSAGRPAYLLSILGVLALVVGLLGLQPADPALAQDPPANHAPQFAADTADRSVAENTPAGASVGAPLTAEDADGDTLTYEITGADAFAIDDSGQITISASLNYETKSSYSATVTVSDGKNADGEADAAVDGSIAVAISVTNVDEPGVISFDAATPQAGTPLTAILADPDGSVSNVIWVWERSADRNSWDIIPSWGIATYTPSADDAGKYLRAAATYADGQGDGEIKLAFWAVTANPVPPEQEQESEQEPEPTPAPTPEPTPTPTPAPAPAPAPTPEPTPTPTPAPAPATNSEPQFGFDHDVRYVAENARAETSVGSPVTADDADGDSLTYALTGPDAGAFDFDKSSGQISVKDALDFETKSSYSVTVTVHDGKNAAGESDASVDDSIAVAISVTNVDEAGVVSLLMDAGGPQVGSAVETFLFDPDGGVTGLAWAWERSADRTAWEAIAGANQDGYTPTDEDDGHYLRATASYTDAEGPGKRAQAATSDPVAGDLSRAPHDRQPQTTNTAPTAQTVPFGWKYIPPDLSVGDSFRLLFITSGAASVRAGSVVAYNDHVQAAAGSNTALAAFSGQFRAVVSTAAVDARDNTGTAPAGASYASGEGEAIWWLGGRPKIADDYADFYDGTWATFLPADRRNESAAIATNAGLSAVVATGSNTDGTKHTYYLGHTDNFRVGLLSPSTNTATDPLSQANPRIIAGQDYGHLYGLSPVITVVAPPPVMVHHEWEYVPDGLGVGDSFRLLFVTSTLADVGPSAPSILSYNNHVQARAATNNHLARFSGQFSAVVSTAAVDARDNTFTTGEGEPIYWLNGPRVADDYADFYDGNDERLHISHPRNEHGSGAGLSLVVTGSNADGTRHETRYAGRYGRVEQALGLGNNKGLLSGNSVLIRESFHQAYVYGLSPVITVVEHPPVSVQHDWQYVPDDMVDGDSFRLLFLTSTSRNAASSDIGDYNGFVQARAATNDNLAGFSEQFHALICTGGDSPVDARDNTGTAPADGSAYADGEGEPIYWLGGLRATDDYADFYGGSVDDKGSYWDAADHISNVRTVRIETATAVGVSPVWSGCKNDGTGDMGATNSMAYDDRAGESTVQPGTTSLFSPRLRPRANNIRYPILALSPVITVADARPAPPSDLHTHASDRAVVLEWAAPYPADHTITGYQYRQDGGDWIHIPGSGPDTTRYVAHGLEKDTSYAFEVRAVDIGGEGPASEKITATTAASGQQPVWPQTVPPGWGLTPDGYDRTGFSFRLLFVTSDRMDAVSDDISDYNNFVHDAARANAVLAPFAHEFRALISTETVDAADNVDARLRDAGVPIFWVGGDMVAPNYYFFYGKNVSFEKVTKDGQDVWEFTYKPLWRSRAATEESGNAMPNTDPNDWVFTGSNDDGTKHPDRHAGNSAGFGVMAGSPLAHDPLSWIRRGSNQEHRIYALSPVITVVKPVTVAPAGEDRLTVSWEPKVGYQGDFGYRVQWRSGSEPWSGSRSRSFWKDTTSGEITGLAPGTDYEVRVWWVDSAYYSETLLGEAEGATLGAPAPLAQVTGVNAASSERRITVTWEQVVGADGYKVQWKSGSESFDDSRQGAALAGGIVPRYEIANLEVAKEYTVRVIAVKSGQPDGPPSAEATARAAGMTVNPTANGLMLTFAAPSQVVSDYRLKWTLLNQTAAERERGGYQDTGRRISVSGDQNGYEITGLQSGRLYKVEMWWRPYMSDNPIPLGEVGAVRPGP